MLTEKELYRRARSTVESRRQKAVTLAGEAARAEPRLAQLAARRVRAGARAGRLAASGAPREEVEQALSELRQLDAERAALLDADPALAAAVTPAYVCPVCRDTGRTEGGGVCACVHALVREMRRRQINDASPLGLCSFERFTLERYPETEVPGLGTSARDHMRQILAYCRYYAEHFSVHGSPSLYMYGGAGLGKTHLALSIAGVVLEKDGDVVYISAQNAFDAIERERFEAPEGGTMQTLQDAELLILDDLGTECISAYVASSLYSLINTRVCRRLPTIYTSNIVSDADLQRRYTEKVVSRLLGSCESLCFCGDDIRLQGK